jgi:hypothetical protein
MTNNFLKCRPVGTEFLNADGGTGRQTDVKLIAIFLKPTISLIVTIGRNKPQDHLLGINYTKYFKR